jgi:type I restriction enzyme R subunit
MYINKKLQGVNAVQTLSRLNRVYPGKKDPITLDFVNDEKTIQKAFQDFYEGVILEEGTDPDKLYDLKRSLEDFQYYSTEVLRSFQKFYSGKILNRNNWFQFSSQSSTDLMMNL